MAADGRHPDGETRGGHDADGGIGPEPTTAGEFVDEQGRRHPPQASPQIEIDLEQKADDRPAEHGVGEAMADVAHAAQDDVHADQAAQGADE